MASSAASMFRGAGNDVPSGLIPHFRNAHEEDMRELRATLEEAKLEIQRLSDAKKDQSKILFDSIRENGHLREALHARSTRANPEEDTFTTFEGEICGGSRRGSATRREMEEEEMFSSRSGSFSLTNSSSSSTSNSSPIKQSRNICRHYLKGRCRYRAACRFSHYVPQCPYCEISLPVIDEFEATLHLSSCWKSHSLQHQPQLEPLLPLLHHHHHHHIQIDPCSIPQPTTTLVVATTASVPQPAKAASSIPLDNNNNLAHPSHCFEEDKRFAKMLNCMVDDEL